MPHCRKIGWGDLIQGLYVLVLKDTSNTCNFTFFDSCQYVHTKKKHNRANVWHYRFRHISNKILCMLSNKVPFNMPTKFSTFDCHVCPLANFRRLSFCLFNKLSDSPFDLLHCDIWDPYSHGTYDGNRYFLTLVDDCLRFTWLYLLNQKSKAFLAIVQFFSMIKTQFSVTMKCLRSNNAKELVLTNFLLSQGTLH